MFKKGIWRDIWRHITNWDKVHQSSSKFDQGAAPEPGYDRFQGTNFGRQAVFKMVNRQKVWMWSKNEHV